MVQRPNDIEALEEKSEAQAKQRGGLLSKYTNVEIFAYILAGISAIGATWSSIGRLFADNIENMTWVQNLKKERDGALDKAFEVLQTGIKTTPSNIKYHQEQFNNSRREIRDSYKKAYSHTLQNEMGVYNTYDKWLQLPGHQKISTFMAIAGVLSIAGVALYTIGKERTIRKKWEEEKDKRIEEAKALAEHAQAEAEKHPPKHTAIATPQESPHAGNKAATVLAERGNTVSTESPAHSFF